MLAAVCLSLMGQVQMGITSVELVDEKFKSAVQSASDSVLRFAVHFRVIEGQTGPFAIEAKFGGATQRQELGAHNPGDHTRIYTFSKTVESEDTIEIRLDPDSTSGTTNRKFLTFQSRVPILHDPNAPAIRRVKEAPYSLHERLSLTKGVPNSEATVRMTYPRSSSVCEILKRDPRPTLTGDYDEVKVAYDANGALSFERVTQIRCFDVRVNPIKLSKVKWADVTADHSQDSFLTDGSKLDVKDKAVAEFVETTVGKDYKTKLTPFETALRLFRGIRATLTYEVTDIYQPSRTLGLKRGQCASGNRLMCAALRHVGIPSRTIGGFYGPKSEGGHQGHRISEFYLAGIGWIPCDATPSKKAAATSLGFGNFAASNLYVTWDDDTKYECGFGFPGRVICKGNPSREVRMELRPL